MPKGVYPHKRHQPGASRITAERLKDFVRFTRRPDIAEQLAQAKRPHYLAVELYHKETGIKISYQCAYKQRGKWVEINGIICKKEPADAVQE